jgi:arylsulfatase A-like enzyme
LIDLYPTLIDFCELPAKLDLDGHSLRPLLKDPTRATEPVISTFDQGNYSIGSDRWRLIRYSDGTEELYDHKSDPHEWHNLADDTRYENVRRGLAKRLPTSTAAPLGR